MAKGLAGFKMRFGGPCGGPDALKVLATTTWRREIMQVVVRIDGDRACQTGGMGWGRGVAVYNGPLQCWMSPQGPPPRCPARRPARLSLGLGFLFLWLVSLGLSTSGSRSWTAGEMW